MSQHIDLSTKKRKHAPAVDGADAADKKAKKDAKKQKTEHKKDKGKARETDTEFRVVQASLVVSVPPVFSSSPRKGVEEMLDSMVMRYVGRVKDSFYK